MITETNPPATSWLDRQRLNQTTLPLLLLLALSIATMIRFDRPLIRGDGVAYLAWLDTLALDQDINFDNQLERLGVVNTYQISWNDETGRFVNIFPFGVAILQAPFYWLGHLFLYNNWWNLNPDYFYQMQGVGSPYSLWLMVGANLMTLCAIILGWRIGRRLTGTWTAAVTSWAVFLGTPLFYYSTVSPLNSHNPGAFTTTCFIYLLQLCTGFKEEQKNSPSPSPIIWVLLGICGGLMVLVRWQLLMVVVPAFGLLAWRRQWKGLLFALIPTILISLPLPIIWQQMFGRAIVVPYEAVEGETFLGIPTGAYWVLWQTPRTSPILFLSLVGFYFLWRIDRSWTLFAAAVIAIQVLVNGAVLDWWGGETYGVRRMTELYPLYVLLACATLGELSAERWMRLWFIGTRIILVGLILYSFLYIFSFFSFTWTNTDNVFIAGPGTMIHHFYNQDNRWQIMAEIIRTHLGPPAWPMPGP